MINNQMCMNYAVDDKKEFVTLSAYEIVIGYIGD